MSYLPVLFAIIAAVLVAIGLWTVSTIIGPRGAGGGVRLFPERTRDKTKLEPFESGIRGTEFRKRFNVKFYLIALLFVIFDVEAVFLYPWAATARELGPQAFIAVSVFLVILVVGLVYEWKKGALEWT